MHNIGWLIYLNLLVTKTLIFLAGYIIRFVEKMQESRVGSKGELFPSKEIKEKLGSKLVQSKLKG